MHGLRRLLYNGFVLQVLPVTLGDMMTLDSWINEKVSKLDAVVQSAAAVTIPHALSVRIPCYGEFTRIWLPPVTNTLREQFVFWGKETSDYVSAGYLVGGKSGWRNPRGLWRMRFFGSLFDFVLNNRMATVVDSKSNTVATISIHEHFMRSSLLEVANAKLGNLRIKIPLLSFHPLTYMLVSDESDMSFRVLLQWNVGSCVAFGDRGIVEKTPSFWPSPFPQQDSDELTALLFHPDDFDVVSRICDRWPPALLTSLCIWAKCFETPRNGYC